MPVPSGSTCLIKTHGWFNTPATNRRDLQTFPNHTDWMMEITRRTGIVLIRNPFKVLYSFRNYNVMGLYGHAGAREFFGKGKVLLSQVCTLSQLILSQTLNPGLPWILLPVFSEKLNLI